MRHAPRSSRLARQIREACRKIAGITTEHSITTVGFAWQPVQTFWGESVLGVADLLTQQTQRMCWRAIVYSEKQEDSTLRMHILRVGGGEIYSLTIDPEGAVDWVPPDPFISMVMRSFG